MEYKTVGQVKYPQNLDPEKQAIIDEMARNYAQELSGINKDNLKNKGRILGGSLVSGASFHPFFNIPYVGTGIGGALYDAGQGIVEGQKLPEIAKRAGRGFVIGETVGAVPYVGKLASKTKAGQAAGKAVDEAAEKFAQTKAYDVLMREIQPLKEIERFKAKQAYNKLGTDAPKFKEFYEGSSLIDENNNPIKLYHGTPSGGFDAFDLNKAGKSNSNEAKLGIWFGDAPHIADNFAHNAWWGNKPQIYETYVNLKKPKIYETGDYKKIYDELINNKDLQQQSLVDDFEQFANSFYKDANLKNNSTVRNEILENLNKLNKDIEFFNNPNYHSWNGAGIDNPLLDYSVQNTLKNFEYLDKNKQLELINYIKANSERFKNLKSLQDELDYLPEDSFDKFLNEIDKYNTNRPHGMRRGFGANPEDIQKYKQDLIDQGYDGIIIKDTATDAEESGLKKLNQYVVFNPNEIKSVDNSGLFDSSVNSLYDKAARANKSLKEQLSGKANTGSYADSIKNAYDDLIAKRKIQAGVNPLSKTGSGMMYDSTPEEWIKTAESLKKGERNPLKYKGESVIINNISPKQKEYIFNEVNSTISDLEKENGSLRRLLHNYDDDSDYLYHIFYDPDGKHNIARSIKIDDDFYDRPK